MNCDNCRFPAMLRHRLPHVNARSWFCENCAKRYFINDEDEFHAHQQLKHSSYTAVIEMKSLNPTREEVIQELIYHNINPDKVVELSYKSLPEGSMNIVPDSPEALELLDPASWTKIELDKNKGDDHQLQIGSTIKVSHVPAILQHNKAQVYKEPNYSINSTDMQATNVQQLFQDCGSNAYYN